jgi:cell division septal protein FtsQ
VRTAAATLRQLPRVALAISRKTRRRLIVALLLVVALLALYKFWFRDSSFVRVQHVTVTGLTTKDADRIQSILTSAAHDMSTMNINEAELNSAVASFPVVKTVEAKASFPHTLRIHVVEEVPTAVLVVDNQRLLLAPDGSVLRGVATGHPLPLIRTGSAVPQDMLTDRTALGALHVAAAAPNALLGRVSSITHGKEGILVHLREGPELIFGSDSRPYAKWAAVAAVLADPSSKGTTYVDVRLPGRPIAGGLASETLAPLSTTGNDTSAQSNAPTGATGATGATGTTGTTVSATPATDGQPSTANPQPSGTP